MYQKQIEEYFSQCREDIIEDIATLVAIQSDKAEEKPGMPFGEGLHKVLNQALSLAEDKGLITKNYDNYVGTIDVNDKETELGILAHLDVVPAGTGWSTNPYEAVVKDGRIYGRGTSDDKGPAVAALYALKAVKDLGIPLSKNVRLILGTDEECGSSDIEYYFSKEKAPKYTFSPDCDFPVINVEKGVLRSSFTTKFQNEDTLPRVALIEGGLKINMVPKECIALIEGIPMAEVLEYVSHTANQLNVAYSIEEVKNQVKITIEGVSAHGSTPEHGNNPITALITILTSMPFHKSEGFKRLCALNNLYPHNDFEGKALGIDMSDDISGKLSMTLNIINYKDDTLMGSFDCRSPLCGNEDNVRSVLEMNLNKQGFLLDQDKMRPPHHVPEDSEFIQTLLKNYELYSGEKGYCMAIGGSTYVHHVEGGVGFGCTMPGTNNRMHSSDEFVVIDELMLSAKIFTQVIIDLCS